MSLRLIFRLASLILVAAAALFGASRFQASPLPQAEVGATFRALSEHAEATRGNVLTVGGPGVVYALPPSAGAVRVLSNANLFEVEHARAARQADAQRRWNYAIEVQELDAGGTVLSERVHHFRRDLVEFYLPEGVRGTGSFYLEQSAPFPLAAANTRMRFDAGARPARLRLRLLSADPDIADVLVRLAVPVPVSQARAESVWRRLNDAQRERLAMGNVFPPKLLTEAERASLIASRWQPIGAQEPSTERDIYVLRGYDLGAPLDRVQVPGLAVGPSRWATVQLPEQGGEVRIVLETDEVTGESSAQSEQVAVRWFGHSAFLRRESSHAWQGGQFERREKFPGGWLEVRASREASVRFLLVEGERETDITPPVQHLRAWEAKPADQAAHEDVRDTAALEFSISHAANASTPLRLVLRRTVAAAARLSSAPVEVSFLDAEGATVRKFELKPEMLASSYDAPWPEAAGEQVSDPWEVFFAVPQQVAKLRIAATAPTLVNAYVRPAHLPRMLRMPEDLTTPEAAETAIPGWFALNPDRHDARILAGQSSLLTLRGRPPEDRPELSAGQYQWEDFDPVQGGAARVFLAPREAGVPERREAIGQTYRPLPSDKRASFVSEPGRKQVTARLAWTGAGQEAFRFKVLLPGT
ncbi:MAG TPA: hypothetical protein VM406_01725, partial [Noviherbaspirillum sp.]|nr:hypothetical protein [Noviherbaspirillum sp.]